MFEDLLGNNKIKEFLKNLVETESVSHSYIFTGKERNR